MADFQSTASGDRARIALERFLFVVAAIYWVIAAVVAFNAYSHADQMQSHRLETLSQKGLLNAAGKLDRGQVAKYSAEARANQLCWDVHPKPAGAFDPWIPPECGVYLPAELAADLDAATWAADHPGSNAIAGWAAARHVLLGWLFIFAVICIGGVVVSLAARATRRRIADSLR
jgi:hypothetical protein